MSGLPITRPVAALTTALYQALAPVADTFRGAAAYYWLRSVEGADDALTSGALSGILIAQAQTPQALGGWIGEAIAEGVIVIRAVAMTDDAAEALRDAAVAALAAWDASVAIPESYRVTFTWQQEPIIPPVGPRYTAAAQYLATVQRVDETPSLNLATDDGVALAVGLDIL